MGRKISGPVLAALKEVRSEDRRAEIREVLQEEIRERRGEDRDRRRIREVGDGEPALRFSSIEPNKACW